MHPIRQPTRSKNGRVAALVLTIFLGLLALSASAVGDRGADGEFERRDSFHFTLYQDVDIDDSGGFRGSRNFERAVLQELEGAFDRLDDLLGLRPERKLDVYVWDPALFDEQFAGISMSFRLSRPA